MKSIFYVFLSILVHIWAMTASSTISNGNSYAHTFECFGQMKSCYIFIIRVMCNVDSILEEHTATNYVVCMENATFFQKSANGDKRTQIIKYGLRTTFNKTWCSSSLSLPLNYGRTAMEFQAIRTIDYQSSTNDSFWNRKLTIRHYVMTLKSIKLRSRNVEKKLFEFRCSWYWKLRPLIEKYSLLYSSF